MGKVLFSTALLHHVHMISARLAEVDCMLEDLHLVAMANSPVQSRSEDVVVWFQAPRLTLACVAMNQKNQATMRHT